MRVLVTGGAGYIGSHACAALAEAGHIPVAYDNLSEGHAEQAMFGPLVEADLADHGALHRALREHRIEAVMHFAARAYVGESVQNPIRYFSQNTKNSIGLIELAIQAGIDRIVFSSTCATYGEPASLPIDETFPQKPVNPYGLSKLMVEQVLQQCEQPHGLHWVALRYFNVIGARPELSLGERHEPETHLVPLAIDAALGNGPALQLFGDDYPTPDGTALRDYIDVGDLAGAHVKALDYLERSTINDGSENGERSLACNIGTGRATSVKEIIDTVGDIVGSPVPHSIKPRRAGDPPALVADPSLAKVALNWTATTQLEESIHAAVEWHKTEERVR